MPTDLPPRLNRADGAAIDGAARAMLFALVGMICLLILGASAGLAVRAFCWLAGIC